MNHLGRAAKELVKDSGGEFVEEAFIEWTNGAVNEFLNSQLGTNYDEQTASAKEVFSAGLIGLAAGGVMSGPRVLAGIADYKSNIQQSYQNLLSDVVGQTSASLVRGETVANPEAFKEYLSQAVQDGQIDQKDADKYSAAIQSAANRTKFTNDIDVSTGAFKDLRDNRGLEARESFINLVRNTAFNKALTESIDDTNQFAQEEQSAKVQQYENVIKELELNAHKAIYSSATPTIIGLQRGLNPSQISELRNKQAKVLEEVNATKLNAVNKAKAVELKLNDAANTILKSKENISDKEKAKLEEIDKQIKTVTEDLNKTNTEEAAKAAVSANTATPEQVQAELIKAKQSVDDLFTGQKTLKDNELPDFSIDLVQQLLENTPDMLKGEVSKYIDKKLEAINAQAYRQQVQNLNEQEKTAKPTSSVKLSPAAAFETRYNGNIELETTEGDTFRKDYISKIETERNDAFTRGEADILTDLDDDLIAFESITSFRDAYINDPKFREFVDANTNAVASKPNTAVTQEQKQAETDEKAKKEAKKQQEIAKKQENIKDVAKDKELYEAAKIIVEKQYASQAFLVKELGITNEKAKELLQRLEATDIEAKKADIEIGKVGNTEYEVKVDGVYYQGKKLNNPENKTHRQLIEADIERRRQEELKLLKIYGRNASGQATWFGMMISQETLDGILAGEEHEVHTFIHEFIHGFTTSKIVDYNIERQGLIPGFKSKLTVKEKNAIEQLQRIFEKVKRDNPKSKEYGFTNLDEFIAEAFSNSGFQYTLKNTKAEGKKSNLFSEFINAVGDILFEQLERWAKRFNKEIPDRETITGILEDVLAWTEDLIDQNNKLAYIATNEEINAKYDAELKALEQQPTSTTQSEIEAKKADIERRRQEELNQLTDAGYSIRCIRLVIYRECRDVKSVYQQAGIDFASI
jgi:hypothetical protein